MAKIIKKSDFFHFFFILQHVLEAVLGKKGMLSITMLYLRKKSQSKMVIPNDFFGKRRLNILCSNWGTDFFGLYRTKESANNHHGKIINPKVGF